MRYLKKNTATVITVGPFFDVTDGITPETALTVTGCHLTLMVDNAGTPTLALDADATASGGNNDMVHITNDDAGMYSLELTDAQTNYVGGAILTIIDTDVHLPVFHEFTILPANIYDSMIAGSDLFDVSVTQWTGTSVATPDTAGYPKVTVKSGTGTGELNLSSGRTDANTTYIAGAAVSTSTAQLGVNLVNIAGSAVSTTTAQLGVNVVQVSGDADAADNLEVIYQETGTTVANMADFFDGTGYAGGTTPLNVNATQVSGNATTADNIEVIYKETGTTVANLADFFDGTGYAGGTTKLTVDLSADAVDDIWDEDVDTAHQTAGTAGKKLDDAGAAGDPWSTSLPGSYTGTQAGKVLSDVLTDTAVIGAAGAGLTAVPWNSAWNAEVESECDDALKALNLDHLCSAATASSDMTTEVVDGSIISRMISNGDTSAFDQSTDSLHEIVADAATVDNIWAATTRTLTAPTNITSTDAEIVLHSDGKVLLAGTTHTSAVVPTVSSVTAIAAGGITATSLGADCITSAKIADDAISSEHLNTGAITADALAADAVDEIVTDILVTPANKIATDANGYVTAASVTGAVGSVTGNVGGNVVGSVGSVTGAVGSVTGNVGGNVVGSVASVSGAVGSVTGNVGGNVTGSVGSVATGGITSGSFAAGAINGDAIATDAIDADAIKADAALEIADALLNRDMSAVSDTNSRSPLNALRFLRNKWTISGTTLTVTEENDSTAAWTATLTTNVAAYPVTECDPGT